MPVHSLDLDYPLINTYESKEEEKRLKTSFEVCSLVPIILIGQGLLCEGDYIPAPKPHTFRCGSA